MEQARSIVENVSGKIALTLGAAGGAAGVSLSFIDQLTSWFRLASVIAGFLSICLGMWLAWRNRDKSKGN
jgi:hypothetical protein